MDRVLGAYQQGAWAEAESLCRLILNAQGNHFGALQVLGTIAAQTQRTLEAAELLSRAVAANPGDASAHNNRGNVMRDLRRYPEALESFDRAIALKPDYVQAHVNRGNTLRDLGRHAQALESYARAVGLKPDFVEAHANRGAALHELGQLPQALASYERALALRPDFAEAWVNSGNALRGLGRQSEAVDRYDHAIAVKPEFAEAHNNRGNALHDLHRHPEALESYERAVAIRPDYAEAHNNGGNVLQDLHRHAEALESYERAIALRPDFAQAFSNQGNALRELQRHAEALESYDRAIALKPDYAEAHSNRANALRNAQRYPEALASFDRAVALKPDSAQAWNNRGVVLTDLRRHREALESLERAIALRPEDAEIHCNRGVAMIGLGRPAVALESYDRAIALKPDYAEAHGNRGLALVDLGRCAEAVQSYERAIALMPDLASAHFGLAACRLLTADFAAGWAGFEWRWKDRQLAGRERRLAQPLWLGESGLEGQAILLHAEQGLGDTLQFCRYAARVAALGASAVILEVQAPLVPLLAELEGATIVLAAGTPLPDFDCHCPLLSLPLAFRTEAHDIPAGIPYLRAAGNRVAAWRERLGAKTRPRVGLAWCGNAMHRNDRNRSIALAEMLPAMRDGIEFVSLQKEVREADAELLASSGHVRHFGSELKDFADTAALVELMDAVVTVDTSVAHLAGAMGKTEWILLPFNPDWRWQLDREDSPWYPTARLLRQPAPGDWGGIIHRLRDELGRRFLACTGIDRS